MPIKVVKYGPNVSIASSGRSLWLTTEEALDMAKLIERVANDPPAASRVVAICGPAPSDMVSSTN